MNKDFYKNQLDNLLYAELFEVSEIIPIVYKASNNLKQEDFKALMEEYIPLLIINASRHKRAREFSKTLTTLMIAKPIINNLVKNNLLEYLSKMSMPGVVKFVKDNKNEFNIYETINNNFDYVLSSFDPEALIALYYLQGLDNVLSEENKLKMNSLVENNKKSFAKLIDKTDNSKEGRDLTDIIIKIVDELLEDANLTYKDIKLVGKGAFSLAFQIGDKIFKIGDTRETHIIPNNKRILNPLIRINLSDLGSYTGSIEVSNKVDTNVNLSEQELYALYKELREQGIIFGDMKNSNLGYLLQDNTYHWNKAIGLDPEARGLKGEQEETLKAGELVIIDTDFLYYEDDPEVLLVSEISHIFEARYKKEKEIENNAIKRK